jgi:ATP phosphoribosyltransferase regulatory subunit HisZ
MSSHVQRHRQRLAERGFKRVEVSVAVPDAAILRRVAKVLANDDQLAERLRRAIDSAVADKAPLKFKDWLASE